MFSLAKHRLNLEKERKRQEEDRFNPELIKFIKNDSKDPPPAMTRNLFKQMTAARKRQNAYSALSHSRVNAWADNLTVSDAQNLVNGAGREANSLKRLPFEAGNWRGKLLQGDGKHFDNFYVRNYEPDATKAMNYEAMHAEFRGRAVAHGGNQGDPNTILAKVLRQRIKTNEKQPAFKTCMKPLNPDLNRSKSPPSSYFQRTTRSQKMIHPSTTLGKETARVDKLDTKA